MSVGSDDFIKIIRNVAHADSGQRAEAADASVDWSEEYDEDVRSALAMVLAGLAVAEVDSVAQEAQLNALATLAGISSLPRTASVWLTSMDREALSGSAVDHWDELTG
ncbi:hypothetical protein ACQCX2_13785 [Propionibacteriaceae bacterium Y1700]|uniref:hypothetical protein n=1 Tax=Microlunatus sp. Y1700 TaxID=3418487 RepID=UPI003DA78F60